ncbi:MAG: exosortase/archaeosortase family protein [Deltaproteobacteria bacterium]
MKIKHIQFPSWVHLGWILPLLEVAILKSLVNINFSVRIEPPVLIVPSIVLTLLYVKWDLAERIPRNPKKGLWLMHFLLLVGFVAFTFYLKNSVYGWPRLIWAFWAGAVFFSSFFSVVSFRGFGARVLKEKSDWGPAFMAGTAFWVYRLFNTSLWRFLSPYVSKILSHFNFIPGLHSMKVQFHPFGPILKMPWGKIHILQGCSGFEGICLFFAFWGVILIFDGKQVSTFMRWTVAVFGVFYMTFLNFFRIGSLIYWGNKSFARTQSLLTVNEQVELFHSQYAWGVYWVGLVLFFVAFYLFLSFKESSHPK